MACPSPPQRLLLPSQTRDTAALGPHRIWGGYGSTQPARGTSASPPTGAGGRVLDALFKTKQPHSFGKNRIHGRSSLGGMPWVAITTACPWFRPPVCLGALHRAGREGHGTPSLTPATFSSSQTMDPGTTCQALLLGNQSQT